MIFRRPLAHRWFYPFSLCGLIAVAFTAISAHRPSHPMDVPWLGLVAIAAAVSLAATSWRTWTSKVEVDDRGIRWREGRESRELAWKEIRSMVTIGDSLGLVRRDTGLAEKLPFLTGRLYEALIRRFPRLPPAEERLLFSSFGDWE